MIKSTFKWVSETKLMKEILPKIVKDPDGYGLRVLILANVAKDIINCGFYTYQSLNNKEIPEEKRKFVAALDFTNGILNVVTQVALGFGFTSKKVQDKITGFLFKGLEEKATEFTKVRIAGHNFPDRVRYKLMNTIKDIPASCKSGFKAISTIVITTIVAKRIIVPFIATPFAGWFKAKYMNDKKPNNPAAPNQNPINKITPANMQLPVNPAIKTKAPINSLENFNNFVYKGTLFNSNR